MPTKKCPTCGNEVEAAATICPNCGYQFAENMESAQQEQKTETPETQTTTARTSSTPVRDNSKTLRRCMIAAMIVFALFAAIFFGRANNVRTVYYNSSVSSLNKNAYVGGDAYNFIINGTHFTGYSVTASGCMICAVICGIGAAGVSANSKKEQ